MSVSFIPTASSPSSPFQSWTADLSRLSLEEAETILEWSFINPVARYPLADTLVIDHSLSATPSLRMPDARHGSVGQSISIVNKTTKPLTIKTAEGVVIVDIPQSDTGLFYSLILTENNTKGGTWIAYQGGASGVVLDPSSIAGQGLQVDQSDTQLEVDPYTLSGTGLKANNQNKNFVIDPKGFVQKGLKKNPDNTKVDVHVGKGISFFYDSVHLVHSVQENHPVFYLSLEETFQTLSHRGMLLVTKDNPGDAFYLLQPPNDLKAGFTWSMLNISPYTISIARDNADKIFCNGFLAQAVNLDQNQYGTFTVTEDDAGFLYVGNGTFVE